MAAIVPKLGFVHTTARKRRSRNRKDTPKNKILGTSDLPTRKTKAGMLEAWKTSPSVATILCFQLARFNGGAWQTKVQGGTHKDAKVQGVEASLPKSRRSAQKPKAAQCSARIGRRLASGGGRDARSSIRRSLRSGAAPSISSGKHCVACNSECGSPCCASGARPG